MTRVTLNVSVPECPDGVTVFVTGDCSELGSWSPQAAEPMTLVTTSSASGEVWSTTVEVSVPRFEYRFFTACFLQSFSSPSAGNCGCIVAVQDWESAKQPRTVELGDGADVVNCDVDVYGVQNGRRSVSWGWLTGQSEMCLKVHSQAVSLSDDGCCSHAYYRLKCEPIDMRPADNTVTLCSKHHRFGPVYVGKFTSKDSKALSPQLVDGLSFDGTNEHIIVKIQTCAVEMVAFKFLLYCDSDDENCDKVKEIGVGFYQMGSTSKPEVANIPVIGAERQIVGTLKVDTVVVNSIENPPKDLDFSPQHWYKPQQSLNVGHRGLGKSREKGAASARVPENTVLSFSEAAKSGADMVELDVMLTSDNLPVVFHDFMASVKVTSVDGKKSRSLKVPVSDLSADELKMLNVTRLQDSAASTVTKNEEERPFPTLRRCFEVVDPGLKFNIEVKYCMHLLATGEYEEGVQHFQERNSYVDVILCDIFKHAGDREILLSCFDPDVCTMMRLKQTRYPVAFLSQGETQKYEPFLDPRAGTLPMAVNFANVEALTGIVLHTEGLLKDIRLIDLAHSYGLSVFCWGEENNNVDTIKLLRRHMLDGIIYDRLDEFMRAIDVDQSQ